MNLINEIQSHPITQTQNGSQERQLGCQLLRFQIQADVLAANGSSSGLSQLLAIEIGNATSAERLVEIVNIPLDRVVPIPHLPPAVMGVYNWRGEILWLVDLAMLWGFDVPRARSLQPTIVISITAVGSEAKTIGLVVDEIAEIEWCELDPSAQWCDPERAPWIKGYAVAATGEQLAILDGRVLFERADLHADI